MTEISYRELYDEKPIVESVDYWVTSTINDTKGIEERQKKIIDLLGVLTDEIMKRGDEELLNNISYAIMCEHSDHKLTKE